MSAEDRIEQILIHYKLNSKTLSEKLGYSSPQIIYDIQRGKTRNISEKLTIKIISLFPEINKSWLMTGEGEMLKHSTIQTSHGDNSPNIAGNGNSVSENKTLQDALAEISAMREALTDALKKSQEREERLMAIIEKYNNK